MPPFVEAAGPDHGRSLYWAAVGLGKQSLVVDLEAEAGRERLRALAHTADVLVESYEPGYLAERELGAADLCAVNPALIYVSVTPYGQDGPLAHAPASALTIEAAGGLLSLQGDGDRPPLPVGYPQAWLHAGAQAAADAVIALNERQRSGRGQHLDVSAQACMVWTLMQATGYPPNEGTNPPGTCEERGSSAGAVPGLDPPAGVAPCADGAVFFTIAPGATPGGRTLTALLKWIAASTDVPGQLLAEDWLAWTRAGMLDGTFDLGLCNEARRLVLAYFLTQKKQDLFAWALEHDALIAPVNTMRDVAEDTQLASRDYWQEVDGIRHPGAFARLSRTSIELRSPAPALGASDVSLERLPAAPQPSDEPRQQAFAGLKVVDFSWVGVGPIMAKALGDHGATVVRVESTKRVDVLRNAPPFKDGVAGLDRSQFMADFNSSKLGLALNLGTDAGRELAARLIRWADVVVESFTPGTMARLGLDWDTVSEGRDDLIMISTCLRGQTGPQREYGGFGNQGAALSGISSVTGWPDRPPCGPWGAYSDFIAPRYGIAALASAIYERRLSGRGQYIDLAQVEAAVHFVEPILLDYTVNGRVAPPSGLNSATECPHGVYPARGKERYVALSVGTPERWRALCIVAPLAGFADARFDAIEARFEQRERIDAALEAWTRPQDPFVLAERLRQAGVPASVVQWPTDLYRDPQLMARGFFVWLDHSVMGPTPYDGLATRFSATPGRLRKAAPALGEDTHFVLSELVKLSSEEIANYAASDVLT
jgi:crotonobetainyl-CoA:carnitine CoA-transferase CaiB-like acyl-CoA transferase